LAAIKEPNSKYPEKLILAMNAKILDFINEEIKSLLPKRPGIIMKITPTTYPGF